MPFKLVFLVALLLFGYQSKSQNDKVKAALVMFLDIIEKENAELEDTSAKTNKTTLLYPVFSFYKLVISRNDVPKMCRFHPTCANYGVLAARKYGLLIGTAKASDRILRCNNLHYKNQYTYLPSKNKYVDYP